MTSTLSKPIKACRLCESTSLIDILSLGNQYVSDFVMSDRESPQGPLDLVRCKDCGLVQLRHTFPRDKLYRHYWYKSGISQTMRTALADLVSSTYRLAKPSRSDLVVDIGCNDGTLLRTYPRGPHLIGFEPATNLIMEARKGTEFIFNDFFKSEIFKQKFGEKKAKILTTVAMFYDLEDPNRFVSDIASIMSADGLWVVQQNYLGAMLEKNGFDNIGHEHLEYYSLRTMQELMDRHGLEVFEVETNDVNGGSLRTFICHKAYRPIGESVEQLEKYEDKMKLQEHAPYQKFARNISGIRTQVHDFVSREAKRGKAVYVYGASNRGNTILQYCGLDHKLIKKATDANPDKWGRKTSGTLIPIVSKEEARKDRPDYFLILPTHFLDEIMIDESDYLEGGGRFIVPLPNFRIVATKKQ